MDARYELINAARVMKISKTQSRMPFMDLSISRDMDGVAHYRGVVSV